MKRLSCRQIKFLVAATAAVGATVAVRAAHATPTVSFILSYNDDGDGTGNDNPGDYALYAADSTEAGNYGFAGIGMDITGANNPSDFLEDDLPVGTALPGSTNTAKKAPAVIIGFNEGYSASFPIGGAQDTSDLANSLIAGKPPAAFLTYGVGQTAGSLQAAAPPPNIYMPLSISPGPLNGAYGVPVSVPNGPTFPAAVLVADGTFSLGETLAFASGNNSANLFVENGQANFSAAGGNTVNTSNINFYTIDAPNSPPPPPPPPPPPLFTLDATAGNSGADDGSTFGNAAVNDVVTITQANGSYKPLTAVMSNPKGFVDYGGFTPGDTVYIALKLSSDGNPISGSELSEIINYIYVNSDFASNPLANFEDEAFSIAPQSVQNALGGPGDYDILLSAVAGQNDPFFNYDFSQFTDDPNLVVSGIGITGMVAPVLPIPEPGSIGLLAMGGLAMLGRRRSSKI